MSMRGWPLAAFSTIGMLAVVLGLYGSTAWSLVETWTRSETFAHGYLIVPISAWLIWKKRHEVAAIAPVPNFFGLLLLVALGFVWVMGHLGRVQVVQQYAVVLMLPAVVWTVLGTQVVKSLSFPLGFLLLAVPFGEALIPYMIEFTADFTVLALKLSGIPVYREGAFFTVPSGNWSVVEACSGLRYLISSFTLGCLYAYLTYRSLRRRILFAVVALLVPLVANWLRAYMIVMIGHLSDMRLAVGVDHVIYGWVFFGVVMLALFWFGSFWREDLQDEHEKEERPVAEVKVKGIAWAAALALVAASLWPAYTAYLERGTGKNFVPVLAVPTGMQGWQTDAVALTDWKPRYLSPRAEMTQTYHKADRQVALYLYAYRRQEQGSELINSRNVLVWTEDRAWGKVGERPRTLNVAGGVADVVEGDLLGSSQRLLVWYWYHVDGRSTANPYQAKLLEAWAKLSGRQDDAMLIALAAPYDDHPEHAEQTLEMFYREMLPEIEASVKKAAGS